jgi:hypothetical protein
MSRFKFEIDRARNGQFIFRVKANNGKIVAQSEQYKQKASCLKTVRALRGLEMAAAPIVDLTGR